MTQLDSDLPDSAIDNNMDLVDKISDSFSGSCVKISLRASKELLNLSKPYANSPGSINIYIFTNGLIKVFVSNKLQQEANLQASGKFDFFITDVGESKDIHIDMNSYEAATNSKLSIQLLVASKYLQGQEFHASVSLLGDDNAVGINSLRISNEIQDPQDRDNNQE